MNLMHSSDPDNKKKILCRQDTFMYIFIEGCPIDHMTPTLNALIKKTFTTSRKQT